MTEAKWERDEPNSIVVWHHEKDEHDSQEIELGWGSPAVLKQEQSTAMRENRKNVNAMVEALIDHIVNVIVYITIIPTSEI